LGYLTLAEVLDKSDIRGEAFNFGSGNPVSALEVVQTIVSSSGRIELEPIILNEVKNEIQEEYLCPDKAKKVIGWQPEYTLENGIRETMTWYKSYLNR
jgi:CDP-glucose 4,6-dehydratase